MAPYRHHGFGPCQVLVPRQPAAAAAAVVSLCWPEVPMALRLPVLWLSVCASVVFLISLAACRYRGHPGGAVRRRGDLGEPWVLWGKGAPVVPPHEPKARLI
jgi:hypothetical protein